MKVLDEPKSPGGKPKKFTGGNPVDETSFVLREKEKVHCLGDHLDPSCPEGAERSTPLIGEVLDDLPAAEFTRRAVAKPAGYASATVLHTIKFHG